MSLLKIDKIFYVDWIFVPSCCINLLEESQHTYVKEDNLIVACRVSNELKSRKIMDMISFGKRDSKILFLHEDWWCNVESEIPKKYSVGMYGYCEKCIYWTVIFTYISAICSAD